MNARLNLISKRRKIGKGKNVIVRSFQLLFLVVFISFLSVSGYVTYRIFSLNNQLEVINQEALSVSAEIRQNDANVNKFVLAQGILDYIESIDSGRFEYKRYLDEIVSILPLTLDLRAVDFQTKGWVSASVFIPDLSSMRSFEERITDTSIIDQTVFSSVFSESIIKEKTGGYVVRLQFELKKNV